MKFFNLFVVVCLAATFTVQAESLRVLAIGNSYADMGREPE